MIRRRSDLQLEADPSARFLPWVIAVMVFLAALAMIGAFALDSLVRDWRDSARDTATVQIAFDEAADMDLLVTTALDLLRSTPGVAEANSLEEAQVADLLEPWLGDPGVDAGLPLPRLIDVQFTAGSRIDAEALEAKLRAAVPGATLDDHASWLGRVIVLARGVQWLALGIVVVIGGATVAIIIFATRAGLAAHREAIEVLHLIGARDGYIARQFQRHCLMLALKGGVPGGVVAALVLALIANLAGRLDAPLLASAELGVVGWSVFILLPVLAGLLAMFTARATVLRTLRRMH